MVVFGPGHILPMSLTINAFAKAQGVLVEWRALTEINTDRYEVEKSFNGQQFNPVSTQLAKGSNSPINYEWFYAISNKGDNL